MALQYGNYVKFIRGTNTAWNNMSEAEKNIDTLYFISDAGSAFGKLYLGPKLISNGDLSSATSMSDLNDVLIGAGITDKSILVYDVTDGMWKNRTLFEIFTDIGEAFVGATADTAGTEGLVPAPTAGQNLLFLRGDATWADPVVNVNNTLNALIGEDTNLSIRDIAKDEASIAVAAVVAEAPEAFDTLKEIADWIQTNPDSAEVAALTTKVSNLETTINGVPANEEAGTEAIPGLQEIVGNLQEVIYGVPADETAGTEAVPGLQAVVSTLQTTVAEHSTDIQTIKDAIRWQDIVEERNN